MMQKNIEIYLTSLAHDGRAVGRINTDGPRQQVAFVQGALPEQTVLARIIKSKKNFVEATCTEVLQDMPDAIKSPCVHAHECGGCPLQSMPYAKQLFWKESMLKEALQRIGKVQEINFTKLHPSPLLFEYRNKMEFAIGLDDEQKPSIGLRAKGSHRVISTPHCLLMPKQFTEIILKLQTSMRTAELKPWQESSEKATHKHFDEQSILRHVVLRMPHAVSADNGCHVQIITAPTNIKYRKIIAKIGQRLLNSDLGVTGFVHEERKSSTLYAQGELCITQLGQKYLYEELANVQYGFEHSSFFQVNTLASEHLCHEAKAMAELSGHEIVWDIYCGVGAPSLGFASDAKELYGIEANPKAIKMAMKNAKNLSFDHCHYLTGTAEDIINDPKQAWPKPDVVILDPPRAGLHPKVIRAIIKAAPKRIVYISCNPATLSRDIGLLSQDFKLERVSAVDLFPHTAHVESCSLLTKI